MFVFLLFGGLFICFWVEDCVEKGLQVCPIFFCRSWYKDFVMSLFLFLACYFVAFILLAFVRLKQRRVIIIFCI